MKSVKYVILSASAVVIAVVVIGYAFSGKTASVVELTHIDVDSPQAVEAVSPEVLQPVDDISKPAHDVEQVVTDHTVKLQQKASGRIGSTPSISAMPIVRRIPLEETPLAPPGAGRQDVTAKAFNQAAAVLKRALTRFDKSSMFTSYNGVYAMAVSGKTFILASSDGTVVVFQQSADGQTFETSSGTSCSFIAQKDNYYLAKLGIGAYMLTTPAGEEYTLGGAQNAEDERKPFSSSPAASATIATLAAMQNDLPRDHELYTTPDKRFAVVSTGGSYVIIKSDGSASKLSSIESTEYSLKTDAGTTCPLVAGDSSAAIGMPAPELLIVKDADGTETVLPKTADGSEYSAVPPAARDLNSIPPDLLSDPPYTEGQLVYTDLLNKSESELSLAEQRIRRRLVAAMSSKDSASSSL